MMTNDVAAEEAVHLELKVNGRNIPLNDFAQRFIAGTLCGMLRCLRGVDDIRAVDLTLTSQRQ